MKTAHLHGGISPSQAFSGFRYGSRCLFGKRIDKKAPAEQTELKNVRFKAMERSKRS